MSIYTHDHQSMTVTLNMDGLLHLPENTKEIIK